MKDERTKRLARVIANTLRMPRARPNNILEIADDILWLKKDLGSLRAVSESVGVSSGMLARFLSVHRLCPEVKRLVKERKLDSVAVVDLLKAFDCKSQETIASEVINRNLTSDDIKVLVPFSKRSQNQNINKLIKRVKDSKNKKSYVLYFYVPLNTNIQELKLDFQRLIGNSEIISLSIDNMIGYLEVTKDGLKRIRNDAKSMNLNLKKFIDYFIEKYQLGE